MFKQALTKKEFHKFIIGAAFKDIELIKKYSYIFTAAGANAIDISAFPLSVIAAKQGIEQALLNNPNLEAPLLMISINVGEDTHFRRINLDTQNCTECLLCVPSCPSQAFSVLGKPSNPEFSYDIDLCYGCSNCLEYCNYDALSFEQWSPYEAESLSELIKLGANAIEIHLNNDLETFRELYLKIPHDFLLESFCIGSQQMNTTQIQEATKLISELTTNSKSEIIIQSDGLPLSGARDLGENKDLASIINSQTILSNLQTSSRPIFVQLAGGIDEKSLAKAHAQGVLVDGVAIGSYARKQLLDHLNDLDQAVDLTKRMILESKRLKNN